MIKRRAVLVILLIVAVLIIGFYPVVFKHKVDAQKSNVLKLYLAGDGENYDKRMDAIIREFQNKYPNIKIQKVMFDTNKNGGIEGYVKKMLTDTLAGDGPDILVLDNMSTRKLEKSEMLLDLKPLIEKDKDFKKSDYNMKVMQAGLYNGKQLIMPIDYYVNQYITTNKLLKDNNIKLKNSCSQNDFMNELDEYINSTNEDKNKYLFSTPMDIEDFLVSSGEKFIDYDNKKVYFDKPEFKRIIENYKKIYNSSKKESDLAGISGVNGLEDLKNGDVLFSNDPIDMRDTFFIYESLVNQYIGEKEIINAMPSYKGGDKITAIVGNSLAISKNAKNKQAAYNFIKIAISQDIQGSRKLPSYIPINKKAARDLENKYMKDEVNSAYEYSKDVTIVKQPLSDNFQRYYNNVLDNLSGAQVTDYEVEQTMMKCLTPYFEDRSSYENCVRILENKIKLYLNE
ncbi:MULTISPECIES: extracellular solute-binding protein [Clostridium]|uniref:extracellular solute-binding protein n=1 Tax=Clostridium TaxID=1485 RepID=UPI000824A416|nr:MULTISPECIES: extracellular solute-binding protein [Clostridium]PJI07695.1 sugar ABC transporter substrate-binding protein [Clostridium sp. CT7]